MNRLGSRNLGETQATDVGVMDLAREGPGLNWPTSLDLRFTNATDVRVKAVKERWPVIKVDY